MIHSIVTRGYGAPGGLAIGAPIEITVAFDADIEITVAVDEEIDITVEMDDCN